MKIGVKLSNKEKVYLEKRKVKNPNILQEDGIRRYYEEIEVDNFLNNWGMEKYKEHLENVNKNVFQQ